MTGKRFFGIPLTTLLAGFLLATGIVLGIWIMPTSGFSSSGAIDPGRHVSWLRLLASNCAFGFLLLVGAASLGMITGISLLYNGFVWGVWLKLSLASLGLKCTVALFLPHGLIEVAWILILGACGFRAAGMLYVGCRDSTDWYTDARKAANILGKQALVGLILITGGVLTEAFVTTKIAVAVRACY